MLTAITWVGGAVIAAGLALWILLLASMRTKYQPALDVVRRMNRRVTNPKALRTAGLPGASASVVHHVGRTTGKPYQTPITVMDTGDAFMVFLPYGPGVDWLKNMTAAGHALIDTDGTTYRVGPPQVVGPDVVVPHLSGRQRLTRRLYGVDTFLVLPKQEAIARAGAA